MHEYVMPRLALSSSSPSRSTHSRPPLVSTPPSPSQVLASQPIVSFDWSPDKEGLAVAACLDQTVRVFIVTKLHLY